MERLEPQITIVVDLDDVLWQLVDNWIYHYRMSSKLFSSLEEYTSHDKALNKSMVTSWDIESCLNPKYPELFWMTLDDEDFWQDITVSQATKDALNKINSHKNIDFVLIHIINRLQLN